MGIKYYCATLTTVHSRTFSTSETETLHTLDKQHLPLPCLTTPTMLLPASTNSTLLFILYWWYHVVFKTFCKWFLSSSKISSSSIYVVAEYPPF